MSRCRLTLARRRRRRAARPAPRAERRRRACRRPDGLRRALRRSWPTQAPERQRERELLGFAALLHDIGSFISYRDHHVHSAYLIRNADLLGFDQDETELMAATALFHRKSPPGLRDAGLVQSAEFHAAGKDAIVIALELAGDCHLERWGIEVGCKAAEKVLGRSVRLRMTPAEDLLTG